MLRRLWHHRNLVLSLVRRQYQLRYRQSMAGLAWAVLPPLVGLGTATVVFHGVFGVETPGASYSLSTLAALTPWAFLTTSLVTGVSSIEGMKHVITRLAFPRAALPLSVVGVSLLDLVVAGLVFVGFAYAVGAGLPLTALWFPVIALIEIGLVAGIVLLVSALNVFARDVRLGVGLLVQFWLFLTPVMYPLDSVPDNLRALYEANPMTGIVVSFRQILVFGENPDLSLLGPSLLGAAAALLVGAWYFAATEKRFADVI